MDIIATQHRVGIVGLGAIGGGLATAMARCGRSPVVFDVRPDAAAALVDVVVVTSPAEVAASCDVVVVAVVDAPQVRDVLFGAGGVVEASRDGLIVVVVSTIAVDAIRSIAAQARASGLAVVDAGVSGHPGAAAAGQLVFLLGGDTTHVATATDALGGCARSVQHMGPLGAGLAAKIARNVITYGSWRAVHEACELAQRAGVDIDQLLDAVGASDPTGSMPFILVRGRAGDDTAGVRVAAMQRMVVLMDKDLAAAEQLAADSGVDVPLVRLARHAARQTLGIDDAADDGRGAE